MPRSHLNKSARGENEVDRYDREVLEASVRKSYIFQLAEKGGSKKDKK